MAPATERTQDGLGPARVTHAPVVEAGKPAACQCGRTFKSWRAQGIHETKAAGRPHPGESPAQAGQLDERGAWVRSSRPHPLEPLLSGLMDNGSDCRVSQSTSESMGMLSEPMDLGDNPGSRIDHRPAPDQAASSPTDTLGTVQDHTEKPEPPVLIPQRESTGGRKPYNVRLRMSLVAEVMDRPEFEGRSLAELIELALERLLP